MNIIRSAATAAVASAGTLAVLGMLENTDGDMIRSVGDRVGDAVHSVGSYVADTDIVQDLRAKLSGSEHGATALSLISKAGGAVSGGFDKMVGALADCRDEAEQNGTSMTGTLFSKLTDAVSTGAEYISEMTGFSVGPQPAAETSTQQVSAPDVQGEDGYGMDL